MVLYFTLRYWYFANLIMFPTGLDADGQLPLSGQLLHSVRVLHVGKERDDHHHHPVRYHECFKPVLRIGSGSLIFNLKNCIVNFSFFLKHFIQNLLC